MYNQVLCIDITEYNWDVTGILLDLFSGHWISSYISGIMRWTSGIAEKEMRAPLSSGHMEDRAT
jgi:hypothetical protein